MENLKNIQKREYKTTDQNLFFRVKIKVIKDDLLLSFLSGSELKVVFAIASFIDDENKAYPSQKYLAKLTGLSVSSVSRNVSKLSSKKFLGQNILRIIREKEKGNKFENNRYYLSSEIGMSFGSTNKQTQNHIVHKEQTNDNNTKNNTKVLKKNNRVISSKKKVLDTSSKSIQVHELFTEEEEDTFLFYARIISEDKPFEGNVEYAERVLTKNIEAIGLENWKDLTKILQNHPKPKEVLNHIRYCVSQKGLTYEEAWREWDSKY